MDPRVERHAEVLVEHSARAGAGDLVLVQAPPVARDLVVALHEKLGEVGAKPLLLSVDRRASGAYQRAVDPDEVVTGEHALAALEASDVRIFVQAHENAAAYSDVPGETRQAIARSAEPFRDAMPDRDVYTQYPAPGDAQEAEMSTAAYEAFVYDAVDRDWAAQREFQAQLVDILDPAEEVRVVSGDETDLRMDVGPMDAVNAYGRRNLPDGEVFTTPVPGSVEGTVRFDYPVRHSGREIEDVRLTFEDGEVVEYAAAANEDALANLLETDEGASRLGELGVGTNRAIDRFTHNVLFDEKMGDTIHLALGNAVDDSVPEGVEANESVVHQDIIVDVSEDSFLEVDGEVVQRNGTFVFEDGFEG